MAITDKERAAIREEAEQEVDRLFVEATGRTWRCDAADLQRAAELEAEAKKKPPSDPPPPPTDSLDAIKRDFPDLFVHHEGGTA